MSKINFKFHFEKKPDETIQCNDNESIVKPFAEYSTKIKEKTDELIYYYKGSIFNYDEFNKNKYYINQVFDKDELANTIKIFAFPLRKMKKLSETNKTVLSSSNRSLGMSSSIEAINPINQQTKEETNKLGDTIKNKDNKENKDKIQTEVKTQTKIEEKVEEKKFFNDIVCPFCQTSAIIENDGLKLKTINCENFHRISDIKFDKFYDLEELGSKNIDNLKCNICSTHKYNLTPPFDKLYICTCDSFYCEKCVKSHNDAEHYKCLIENKNYKCLIHGKDFKKYCLDCNKNICDTCTDTHKDHETLNYAHLTPKNDYIEKITKEVENQKKILSSFIEKTRKLLTDIIDEFEEYYNNYILIENTLLNRYKNNFVNFQLLQNLRNQKLFEISIFKDLQEKTNSINKSNALNTLYNLYKVVFEVKKDKPKEEQPKPNNNINIKLKINYKVPQKPTKPINRNVKIFDSVFVENNKGKCDLLINNKKAELSEYFQNYENKEEIIVELTENNNSPITNMSYMFNNCQNLNNIEFISWNTINITNMESLFQLSPITKIPNNSTFNMQNVRNMKAMFCKCTKLKEIQPDINRWNLINVKDISLLFNGCKSITSLPDLGKWDTRNVEDMSYMFSRCTNLKELHGLGKWKTNKVKNMCGMFNRCEQLTSLSSDIKGWEMSNVTDISIMFQFCSKLEKFPEIGKWNIKNVKDLSGLFSECNEVKTLPNISKWNSVTPEVTNMCGVFNECNKLTSIPDISKWKTEKVTDMSGLFCGCQSIKQLPNLSNWNTSNVEDMSYLCDGCSELGDITTIKKWSKVKVKDKTAAFNGCTKLKKEDIDNWMK